MIPAWDFCQITIYIWFKLKNLFFKFKFVNIFIIFQRYICFYICVWNLTYTFATVDEGILVFPMTYWYLI